MSYRFIPHLLNTSTNSVVDVPADEPVCTCAECNAYHDQLVAASHDSWVAVGKLLPAALLDNTIPF